MNFNIIIPARFASSRLPGKPLVEIAGRPMIQHVWEKACQTEAKRIIVATDNLAIKQTVERFGGEVCLTAEKHNSGTERLAEVVEKLNFADDEVIVNIQGDEPLIPPEIVTQVAHNLIKNQVNMATLAVKITDPLELFNPNAVKVVTDQNNKVLYFSRSVIPWNRDLFAKTLSNPNQLLSLSLTELEKLELSQKHYLRHIGIYAYTAGFIRRYINWQPTALEQIESLEQLRVLYYGESIHCEQACQIPPSGVDTAEDLEKVRKILASTLING
ncbi:3-deoxy-manno-octulosonate cytidylyltransferase [Mergibacter septicus]|uniref:3-deoxy-manno-octulosonate cytidylyltransferase n=1 Tax=Mergibacter septicus TaxID=221402 RepID=UPI0011790849|nr:3-deoxy-manno-octulosonate cytidylyltransferase [Mergibacter septicus]AWX13131.1 3-deoxy-manno-octulosonate cytidylyltransferase [Mergibacter septicus]